LVIECATTRPNDNSTKSGRPKRTRSNDNSTKCQLDQRDNSTKYQFDQMTSRPNKNSTKRHLDQNQLDQSYSNQLRLQHLANVYFVLRFHISILKRYNIKNINVIKKFARNLSFFPLLSNTLHNLAYAANTADSNESN
jgi:hypothetical protein